MDVFYSWLNVGFLLVVLFWTLYQAHVSEKAVNRLTFLLVSLATTIQILSRVVPNDSIFYFSFTWQGTLFNFALAAKCAANLHCEYGSVKWQTAFLNQKGKIAPFSE